MSRSGHIVLYTDDPGLGGVAHYNHALLCGLATMGYRVTCIQSAADNPLTRRQAELGVRHQWLDYDTTQEFGRMLSDTEGAGKIFLAAKPDLIIFSNCSPVSNFAAKHAAVQLGLPFIIVEGFAAHYLAEKFAPLLGDLSEQYARARGVIAVCHQNRQVLQQLFGLPAGKGQVIHYGRPARYFQPRDPAVRARLRGEWSIPSEAVLCFTAGRFEPIKGYQYQMEAIRRLRQRSVWPRICFAWAGAGALLDEAVQAVKEAGVGDRVKILGARWDIADWLDAADIFVLPSEYEGMPLAVMEAMAKGLPVAASAVSGIPEELGATGKLLPAPRIDREATIRELVLTMEAWAEDATLRAAVGAGCRDRARALFREERMIEETAAVIEKALRPGAQYVPPGLEVVLADGSTPDVVSHSPHHVRDLFFTLVQKQPQV